ncbi:molybdate ABC transporter substrate-binding protein [Colwellia sp. D2M02]|uniref:molybdate ABC transporter substrate-binding protein n=1 Tax=Colwellia sp. D2M02 TaxID=2841562 RepID=UPI00209103F5|nr:molybdate ABC transporter substrate-binding protein [Colwellia sp. D2M02]
MVLIFNKKYQQLKRIMLSLCSVFPCSVLLFVIFTGTNAFANASKSNDDTPLRIAVAANFAPVLEILLADFENETGIKSQVINGASGAIYLQLKHGAPFDIFLSADQRRPLQLEQDNLIVKNSRKTYATGQLALFINDLKPSKSQNQNQSKKTVIETSNNANSLFDVLQNPPKNFAIANPKIAPYGKAAQETLTYLKLWDIYQKRLIKGININQTFMQIQSKAVKSGLVANSQLVLNNLSGITIPSEFHQPIKQQLVILRNSKNIAKAQQLSSFLLRPSIQNIIVRYGYAKS